MQQALLRDMTLFGRNQEVIHGLTAGEEVDVRVGAGLGEDIHGLLALTLGGVGTGVDGDILLAGSGHLGGQTLQNREVPLRAPLNIPR